jgi:peptidoglycan/xylan/chitin deacetylase (PgdA/CDA1 family)
MSEDFPMMYNRKRKGYISPAVIAGIISLIIAALLLLFHGSLVFTIPLAVFIIVCVVAPFFPTSGFFLRVVSRGRTGKNFVSLTFDDGPDPETTQPLLKLLNGSDTHATFFVTGERAVLYGDLISEILAHGHDIGNHSYHHDPFLMLRSTKTLFREIASTHTTLTRFHISPVAFRPPVGITNPRLDNVLKQLGLYCVTFTCRAFDAGNRNVRGLSGRILNKVKPDDIILLHDIRPGRDITTEDFLREVESILAGLKRMGLQVVPLTELIGKPVMLRIRDGERT